MLRPPNLKVGDTIRIISTARKIGMDELLESIEILKSWGLKPELGKNLFKEDHQFAGSDIERSADFQEAINDDNVSAILFARGGYGSVRIVDRIDYTKLLERPKWLCGYSDVTCIHNQIHNLGIETLHSSMPINFSENTSESLNSLKNALFGNSFILEAAQSHLNRFGKTIAPVVGGNLSIIYSLSGTNSDIDTKGKILFLEDLDEYLYHIDRMMQNLKKSGKLEGLKGLIIGGMTDMNDNKIPYGKTAPEIISEAVQQFHFPVCFDFPAGHQKDNRCLILGRQANFIVDDSGARISF